MKKAVALAMIILTVLCCFTACKKNDAGNSDTASDIKVVDFATTRPKEEPTTVKPNKTMKVNVPASLVASKAGGDIQKYAQSYGYEIIEEDDGSVTMKMDGITYSLMLSGIGMDTMMALGDIVDSGDFPFAVRLSDYNEDFSYILMSVNTKKYKGSPSYAELAELIGLCGLYYQYFTVEEDNKCEVVLASETSGKVLYRNVYTD